MIYKKILQSLFFVLFGTFFLGQYLIAQNDTVVKSVFTDTTKTYKILKFEIKENIAPPIWRMTQKAFEKANKEKLDLILIDLNTYGGMVETADSMRTIILESKIPVIVFINNNAASAGALISIACDSIYMCSGANIGAATVVNQSAEAMPDKYQSYMRSMMRSTAEAKGRNPDIAQAMVDPDVYVEGVSDSGKVLTFTVSEAIEHNFCQGKVETLEDIIDKLGIKEYEYVKLEYTIADRIINFLLNPMVSGLLIMIIIGGIYFELQTPGIGFPIGAAICAAILYFAPHYLEGMAENWEIIIFFVGLVLLAVEIFVIPGFGIAGVAGIIFIVASLSLSMVGNQGFTFPEGIGMALIKAIFIVIFSTLAGIILTFYLGHKMFTTNMFGKLALVSTQQRSEGFLSSDIQLDNMLGKEGTAATILRPAGKVFIENDIYDASVIDGGYIEKGDKILVVKHKTTQLFVRKL